MDMYQQRWVICLPLNQDGALAPRELLLVGM